MSPTEFLAAWLLVDVALVGAVALCQAAADRIRRARWRRVLVAQLDHLSRLQP